MIMSTHIKERPILFSAPMVRAILDGRKTQTRRILKNQPPAEDYQLSWLINTTDSDKKNLQGKAHWINMKGKQNKESDIFFDCPYGKIGERLWVRETFCVVDDTQFEGDKWIDYRATPRYLGSHPAGWDNDPENPEALTWKPSIHMPRWASRILLEITNVRVEQLQDISEEDAIAEGIEPHFAGWKPYRTFFYEADGITPSNYFEDPRHSYMQLWESINGQGSWDLNPWVWVVEFKRI